MATLPNDIVTHLAWRFDSVLSGSFRRNKQDYADIDFPILCPLPTMKATTPPLEGAALAGPFLYFVLDRRNHVHYVGKSKEKTVIKRWLRPGLGGPTTHYWTHTNKTAGCVRRIAAGIAAGDGPFQIRFIPLKSIPVSYMKDFDRLHPGRETLEKAERGLISILASSWNK